MKTIFHIYKTDAHHTISTRELVSIATSKEIAIHLIDQIASEEGAHIDEEQYKLLHMINQTQGYTGDGEFVIEEIKVNIMLWKDDIYQG